MDIICKPKYNAIFWRESDVEKWTQAKLIDLIDNYNNRSVTTLNLWQSVCSSKTGKFLYNVWECAVCDELICVDEEEHGYNYCPYCGRLIVDEYF